MPPSLITTKTVAMKFELDNVHPGEVLREDFLVPMEISAYQLAKATGMPQSRVSEILKERRSITADTALRLSKFFGTSEKFWLGLQNDYDLEEAQRTKGVEFDSILTYQK
jgi:addiction module HigA family antidote